MTLVGGIINGMESRTLPTRHGLSVAFFKVIV